MGVTLLPRTVADNYGTHHPIRYHRLPSEFASVKTVFIRRNDVLATPALTTFVNMARGQLVQTASPSGTDMLDRVLTAEASSGSTVAAHAH